MFRPIHGHHQVDMFRPIHGHHQVDRNS